MEAAVLLDAKNKSTTASKAAHAAELHADEARVKANEASAAAVAAGTALRMDDGSGLIGAKRAIAEGTCKEAVAAALEAKKADETAVVMREQATKAVAAVGAAVVEVIVR
jgi:hypothetical protein